MRFIETPIFTRTIVDLLDDEGYHALQLALLQRPKRGAVIRGGGGLRKLRWSLPGMGRRSAVRLIYFWDEPSSTFYMFLRLPEERARGPDRPAAPPTGPPGSRGVRVKKTDFDNLVASIRQAGRIKRGEAKPSRVIEYSPVDVKAIRAQLGKSQSEFAHMIGVSVATLQNWEQGRRRPEGPARALLKVAAANPKAVAAALTN